MGAVENVNIKWKDHAEFLSRGIGDFFRREYLVDTNVTFYGDCVKVHRLILALFLPAFKRSLDCEKLDNSDSADGGDADSSAVQLMANSATYLSLDCVANQHEDVRSLVEFIYTGQVTVGEDRLGHLKQLADDLNFDSLVKAIDDRAVDKVPVEIDIDTAEAVADSDLNTQVIEEDVTVDLDPMIKNEGLVIPVNPLEFVSSDMSVPEERSDFRDCGPKEACGRSTFVRKVFVRPKSGAANAGRSGERSGSSSTVMVADKTVGKGKSDGKERSLDGNRRCGLERKAKMKRLMMTYKEASAGGQAKTRMRHTVKDDTSLSEDPASDRKEQEALDRFCQEVLQTWEEAKAISSLNAGRGSGADGAKNDSTKGLPKKWCHKDVMAVSDVPMSAVVKLPACAKCSKKFLTERSLEKHRQTCGQLQEYDCKLCGYRTTKRKDFMDHRTEEHQKKAASPQEELFLKCPTCEFTCNAKYKLRGHIIRRHVAEREYKCPECLYSAMYRGELERHISRKHANEKRFVCDQCGKRYQTKGGVNRHVRAAHEGIKDYKCDYCGKYYRDKRSMLIHVQIKHTGNVELHICDICGNIYNRRWNLQYHMRHAHGTSLEPLKKPYGPRNPEQKTSVMESDDVPLVGDTV